MNLTNFEQQIQAAQQRWEFLQQTAKDVSNSSPEFQQELITEMSVAMEELRVATEELSQQNKQLADVRQKAESNRQHYQELFELAPDGYLVTDVHGLIKEVNQIASIFLNIPKKYLINKPISIFIAKTNLENFNSQWSQIILWLNDNVNNLDNKNKKNLLKSWEMLLQPRDKEAFPVGVSFSVSCRGKARVINLRWLLKDLSQAKETEQKIIEQAALLDVTTDAIIVHNMQDQIMYWNKAAEQLYGWTKEEARGKNISLLLSPASRAKLAETYQSLFQKGQWQGELYQVTKAGKGIIVESRWSIVRDDQNNFKSILVVNTDITLTKQLEAQRQQNQRLEIIGSLASGISHDLNNILTPILGMAQLLTRKFPHTDSTTQQMFKTIEINAQRGAALLKQLLMFSRGIKSKHSIVSAQVLILEIKQIVQETFPKLITIHQDIPSHLWGIYGDITQIYQVLINLCLNARDAMPKGGTLKISAENLLVDECYAGIEPDAKVGTYIVIKISDTGVGIPLEIRNKIFEPFFTNKPVGKGTGLGLSIVKNIVKNHGGFIKVSSEVGKGTQVQVFLPAVETTTESAKNPADLPKGNGALILIVDDEADINYTTQAVLQTYDYQIITANNGIEAIALYAQYNHKIAAVLIDMVMPSMDGETAICTLLKINRQVKIIATSGLFSLEQMTETLNNKVKAFLPKPYTSEELLTTVYEVLI